MVPLKLIMEPLNDAQFFIIKLMVPLDMSKVERLKDRRIRLRDDEIRVIADALEHYNKEKYYYDMKDFESGESYGKLASDLHKRFEKWGRPSRSHKLISPSNRRPFYRRRRFEPRSNDALSS